MGMDSWGIHKGMRSVLYRHHVKVIGCIDHLGRCIAENDCKNHANDRDGHAQDFICLLRQMGNHHINMDMATPGQGFPHA